MGLFGAEKVIDPMADAVGEARERRRIERAARLEQKCEMLEQENARLRGENKALAANLAEMGRRLDEVRRERRSDGPASCKRLRREVETAYEVSRERALALTKLDECEMWLGRCEPRETAAPTLKGAAQDAAMPCLKADEAHGFAMPDVNVEVTTEKLAETVAKSLRESMQPAMRMAVE